MNTFILICVLIVFGGGIFILFLWAVLSLTWMLFGDIIERRLQVNESKKRWKEDE